MKRIVLFLATNLAVMLVLSVVLSLLGVNRFLAGEGLNVGMLVIYSGSSASAARSSRCSCPRPWRSGRRART
jgi:hypothetical protein